MAYLRCDAFRYSDMFVISPSKPALVTLLVHILFSLTSLSDNKNTAAQTSTQICKNEQGVQLSGGAEDGCKSKPEQILQNSKVWDKNLVSREQYQRKFCKKTCRGLDEEISEEMSCPNIRCFDCICERPACDVYGICCPTAYQKGNHREGNLSGKNENTVNKSALKMSSNEERIQSVEFPVLKCEEFDEDKSYLYIQSCPSDFSDSQTRKLCEQDHDLSKGITLDQFARVTDTVTKVTYYNKYCALCNGANKTDQWNVNVTCDHFLYVYHAKTFDQLLSSSLRPKSACRVKHVPLVKYRTSCRQEWFNTSIGRCNETGLWQVHDEDVERACQQLNKRSLRVSLSSQGKEYMFHNIFCAICNVGYPDCRNKASLLSDDFSFGGSIKIDTGPDRVQPPFSLILGFRRRRSNPAFVSPVAYSTCGPGEWASPDGRCLQLECSPGKVPQNGTCITALTQIRGLGYRFSMMFESHRKEPQERSNSKKSHKFSRSPHMVDVYNYLKSKISSALEGSLEGFQMQMKAVLFTDREKLGDRSASHNKHQLQVTFWLQILVIANKTLPRDDFEMQLTMLVDILAQNTPKIVSGKSNISLIPRMTLGDANVSSLCSLPEVKCESFGTSIISPMDSTFSAKKKFLSAKQNLNCLYVQFNNSNFEIDYSERTSLIPSTKLSLTLGSTSLVFTENSEFTSISMDEKGFLHVCREVLDSKLKKFEEERMKEFITKLKAQSRLSAVEKAQYYLTLVCLSASMICLVLTLLTYFSFRVLRNQAGLNNIFLCGSLLMAQAFLLASSHVSRSHSLCAALGMLTHFLWLWMFVWSFICCFHMFRVFTMKNGGHKICMFSCLTSSMFRTVMLSLLFPTAVVCTVFSVSLIISEGDRTGYGRESCYLDSALLVGLTTVLPLALITVSNAVFFTITATKIQQTRNWQSQEFFKKSDRTNLYIYIKLSTITGVFWVIQILAEGLNNDVLRFIAILSNGLQGVFIFVSYICNQRILNLYRESIGEKLIFITSFENSGKVTQEQLDLQSKSSSLDNKKEQSPAVSNPDIRQMSSSVDEMPAGEEQCDVMKVYLDEKKLQLFSGETTCSTEKISDRLNG